jgi:hypothetical protein
MKFSELKVFAVAAIGLLALNSFWFISGGVLLQQEAPFRFVIGSLLIFLLPGMVWGEVLGFRSKHLLETIALSFALTLTGEVVLLPFPFLFRAGITLWLSLLIMATLAGAVLLLVKKREDERAGFLSPLWNFATQQTPFKFSIPFFLLVIVFVSYGVFRWGENIAGIDGEKLLHLTFVRYYSSMQFVLNDLGIYRGMPPQNLVHLWEFLLAAWSTLIHVDPLLLFYRARFVIPMLGFSGMYLLISNIFRDRLKVEVILWGTLIMCLGWFTLLSPSSLDWIKEDPMRGIMSFMGTAHHADASMELLVPLSAALVLLAFRKPGWRSFSILAGVLAASFMWHVREFFQAAVYFGIFGMTLLVIPTPDRKKLLKKAGAIAAVFVVIALCFMMVIALKVPKQSQGYDEMKLKEVALSYALQSITEVRSLFHFPSDLRLTAGLDKKTLLTREQISGLMENGWNLFLWLMLSAFAVPLLAFKGTREDKHLSLFYILLWFLTLCWGFSQLMLIVLTYSEIDFTTPRFLYIFSYIIIASAFYLIFQILGRKLERRSNLLICFAVFFVSGLLFKLWWANGMVLGQALSVVLTLVFLFSFAALLYPNAPKVIYAGTPDFFKVAAALFVFFVPILAKDYADVVPRLLTQSRPAVEWFSDGNPFGLSKRVIEAVRALPPKKTVLVNPLGSACISVYSPQYTAIAPQVMGVTLLTSRDVYSEIQQGKNPLFNFSTPQIDPAYITKIPDFSDDFRNWKGPDSVENDIARAAPPLVLQDYKGKFIFRRMADKGGIAVRVSVSPGNNVPSPAIAFGYASNDNGFNLKLLPGQEALFVLSVRVSGGPGNPPQVFIIDRDASGGEMASEPVTQTSWKQYSVSKRIRNGTVALAAGVIWSPENKDQWLEIKDARIYVADSLESMYKVPDAGMPYVHLDSEAVKKWLNEYHVDYLLIQKDYYSRLLPYFESSAGDYSIVFNNKDKEEVIVRYLHKE